MSMLGLQQLYALYYVSGEGGAMVPCMVPLVDATPAAYSLSPHHL